MSTDVLSSSDEEYPTAVNAPAASDARTSASVRNPLQSVTNGVRWLRARLEEVIGRYAPIGALFPSPVESTDATADTVTLTGHGLVNGDIVRFKGVGGGTPPGPLSVYRRYYVVNKTTDTFQLAATAGGSALNITGALSGTVYVAKIEPASMVSPVYRSAQLTGTTATITPDNSGTFEQGTYTTRIMEPGAAGVLSLAVASGSMPGARWRFYTSLAFAANEVEFKSEGGSVQCTFPAGGSLSWCEFEASTVDNGTWMLVAWGGSTTTP